MSVPQYAKALVEDRRVAIEWISPEWARELLDLPARKRSESEPNVNYLAGCMEREEWRLAPDAVMINEDGGVDNGRHRLRALVSRDVTLPFIVYYGGGREEQEIADLGRKRSFADQLAIDGTMHYREIATAVRTLYRYELEGVPVAGPAKPSLAESYKVLRRHPGIPDSIGKVNSKEARKTIQGSVAIPLHYIFSRSGVENAPELADRFFHRLITGDDLEPDSPIFVLKDQLYKESERNHRPPQQTKATYLVVMAWRLWNDGATRKKSLSWDPDRTKVGKFPLIPECTIFRPQSASLAARATAAFRKPQLDAN